YARNAGYEEPVRFRAAIRNFEDAVRGNPLEPYYEYNRLKYYGKILNPNELQKILPFYEKTIEKDPKDPKLRYLAGKELLTANTARNPVVEAEAKKMLMACLALDRSYTVQVYKVLWDYKKNLKALEDFSKETVFGYEGLILFLEKMDLWQYHRDILLRSLKIDHYTQSWDPASVIGKKMVEEKVYTLSDFRSISGKRNVSHEKLYTDGEIGKEVEIPTGESLLVLKVRSNRVERSYGYLLIRLDHRVVNSLYINSEDFGEYTTRLKTEKKKHFLTIEFVNNKKLPGQDRDVWIREIRLRSVI
ncbi:MAG: hypothetical protein HY072_05830, partial [Deltaproteobacteria bacterium]|nr:hypothetical protein [Deltaproteobacteria bacterium]